MSKQTVLITGTNSGFGKLTAETLARRGHTVIAAMRGLKGKNEGAAQAMREWAAREKLSLHVVELDVSSDASVEQGVAAAIAAAGRIDVVVNNAGLGALGLNETISPDQLRNLLEVNVVGPHRVNRAVLPQMRKQGAGLLLHVSSTLGRFVLPAMGLYGATKFALESVAESYKYDLAGSGIDVAIVQPGAFPTNIGQNSLQPADPARAQAYGKNAALPEMLGQMMGQMFSGPNAPNPQQVADAIVALVEAPAGKRPLRTVVDPMSGQGAEAINGVSGQVQAGSFEAMGMKHLL